MSKIIEFHPNLSLLNPNFEKYQFCPDGISIDIEKKLENEVLHELCPNLTSWVAAKLFALQNHLFTNHFDESCWFVDKTGVVWRFTKTGNLEKIHKLKPVCENQIDYKYNPTIGFASKNITVMSNGSKNLEFLIDEGPQKQSFIFDDVDSGIIMDVQHLKKNPSIIVSICSIVEVESKTYSHVTLLTYSYQKNEGSLLTLCLFRKQMLRVKGTVEYIYVEDTGNYFHIASENPVVFEYDSLHPIEKAEKSNSVQKINIPKYCWSQDENSLTVFLKIPNKCNINSPKVIVQPTNISVEMNDMIIIQGVPQHRLEPELTTWKMKDETLEIEFMKSESGLMWSELLKGDTGGKFLPNEALTAEVHFRLSHLCLDQTNGIEQPVLGFDYEKLEECDFEGSDNIIQIVNMTTHDVNSISMLGSSNYIIFTQKIQTGHMLCLRHEHDGCVWVTKQSDDEKWDLEHIRTFPGFGYIVAGNSNKKFCVSPPSGSFIAIVEHTKNAFVYQKPENSAAIGKQKVIYFGIETSEILGAAGLNEYLIVLKKDMLIRFRVY